MTTEFVDLEARHRNLISTETQLVQLLSRAQNVDEVLRAQREISTVRSEIERLKGRMDYLKAISAESKITVSVYPESSVGPIIRGGWHPDDVAKTALRGLIVLTRGVINVLIFFAVFSPVWVPLVIGSIWLERRAAKWAALKPPPPPPVPTTSPPPSIVPPPLN